MKERMGSEHDPMESDTGSEAADSGGMLDSPVHGPSANTRLIPGQMKLLAALVLNPDMQSACRAAGVPRSTAYRWLGEPAIQDELNRRRDAALAEALATVKTHATRAAAELGGLLSVKDDRLRRQVCNDILAHAMRVRELEDIEHRLAVLEKAMAEKEKRRNA
jgi:hypothetical protein